MLTRFFYGIRIALRQAFHEWLATLCLCMAIAAVILPILLMFGLKNGVIYSKTEKLRKDPNTLLIRPNGRLDSNIHWSIADLRAIETSPNLQHVVPQADMVYRLGAYLESDNFKLEQKYFQTRTQFRITQENDPLLTFGGCQCPGDREIVLNFALAKTLQVKEGDVVTMSFDASANALTIPLKVAGVLPDDYVNVDGVSNTFACVNLQLANAIIDVNSGEDAFGADSKKLTSPPAVYAETYWVPNRPMSDAELSGQLPDFNIISSSLSAEQKALLPEGAIRIQYAKTATSDAQKDEWKKRMTELGKQGTVLRWVNPFTTVMEKDGTNVTLSCAYNTPRLCAAMQEQCSPEHATLYENEPFAEEDPRFSSVQKRRHAIDCAEQLQKLISEGMAAAASDLELFEKRSQYQQALKSAEEKLQGTTADLGKASKDLGKAKNEKAAAEEAADRRKHELDRANMALKRAKNEKAAAERAAAEQAKKAQPKKEKKEKKEKKDSQKDSDSKDNKSTEGEKSKDAAKEAKKPDPVPGAQRNYNAAVARKKAADDKVAAAQKKLDNAQKEFDKNNDENTQAQNELNALKDNPPASPEDRSDSVTQLKEAKDAYQKALEAAECQVPEELNTLAVSLSNCLSGEGRSPETIKENLQKCQESDVATRLVPHFTFDELYPLAEGSAREEVLILSKNGADANGKALVRIEKRYGLPGETDTLYTAPEDAARLSYCASAYHWNYTKEQEEDRLVRIGRYYKFVAYAKDMDAVEPALKELSARGIECTSSVGEIQKTRKLDRHLTLLLLALSSLSGTGGMVALVLNLVNSAEKRRKDYALLRTIGVGRVSMALMPIYESLFVMICTLLICFAAYYSLHFGLNSMAGDLLDDQETMFSMPLRDLLSIVGICLMLSVVAALLSAFRLSRLSPAEYLREM